MGRGIQFDSNGRVEIERLSKAARGLLFAAAEAEREGKMLGFRRVDYRVYSALAGAGLVASSGFSFNKSTSGVCLTPLGRRTVRRMASAERANGWGVVL